MRSVALGIGVCGLVLTIASCLGPRASEADSRFLNLAPDVQYVGSATCATCHEEIAASYQSHGMAQSFYPLAPDVAVEDFSGVEVRHEPTGFVYVARREGDRFVQEEYREEPDGTRSHELTRTMDYVVGSGSAARTYLSEENGRLYELPLTWYTQAASDPEQGTTVGNPDGRSGHWALSPGYAEANGRFDRLIPPRCMACHNGTSEAVPYVEGKYTSLANGIGCEQCHGPGELHVEARLAEAEAPDSVDVTIVNPAHLSLDLALDVCQQCHLNGDVSVLRDGETATSYRPGRPLSAHRAIFEAPGGGVGVISHADRMKASACFRASDAMTCVTCHNPHEGFRDKGHEYFDQTCQSCHEPAALQAAMPTAELTQSHAAGARCFSCHMPKVTADDAPHASFTDHMIRVVRGSDSPTAPKGDDLEAYYDGDAGSAYEGMAYLVYAKSGGGARALRRGAELLEAALGEQTASGEARFLLGFARLQMGQVREAIEPLRQSVEVRATPERLNALAQAYEQTGRPPSEAEALYRQALAIQPAEASIRVNLGRILEAQGKLALAVDAYRAAIQEEPWLATAHVLLGGALAKAGDAEGAIDELRQAIQLEPDQADALTNLGVLIAQSGRSDEAGRLFRRAVVADPRSANAQANLALYWLNEQRPQDALQAAQQALALDPNQGTARQVLAILQQAVVQ